MKPHAYLALLSLLMSTYSLTSAAKTVEVKGTAEAVIENGDIKTAKANSLKSAKKKAVKTALTKLLGPEAAGDVDPSVVTGIVDQLQPDQIVDIDVDSDDARFTTTVTLDLDDLEFQKAIADLGGGGTLVAADTARILVVIDEFSGRPHDPNAVLEDRTVMHTEKGGSFGDKSSASASAAATAASSLDKDTRVDARSSDKGASNAGLSQSADASLRVNGDYADAKARQNLVVSERHDTASSLQGSDKVSAREASSSSASAAFQKNISSETHDNAYFEHLVKYQPDSAPTHDGRVQNALKQVMLSYSMNLFESDAFRSQFFKKAIRIEDMKASAGFAEFAKAASKDKNAKADYMMVGSASVVDQGINPSNNLHQCSIIIEASIFSTLDGRLISAATNEQAANGISADDCGVKGANRLAGIIGPDLADLIKRDLKTRLMYGTLYVVRLSGTALPLATRMAFANAVKHIGGANATDREQNDTFIELEVKFKGSATDMQAAVLTALNGAVGSSKWDGRVDGTDVEFCAGPCKKPAPPPIAKSR